MAYLRGDEDDAARQYQHALGIFERLRDQAGMARSYHQLSILEKDRGGSIIAAVTWHLRALAIRLRLSVPQAVIDLRSLAALRRELDAEPFTRLLTQAAGGINVAETITSLLDQMDETGGGTA